MTDETPQSETEAIPTNLRLIRLIEEVARAGAPISPPALIAALGLPKATVHRLLATAEEEGFLQRDVDGRSYGPGQRMRHLAGNTLSSQRIRTERLMVMKELAEDVGETCNLAVPARFGMVYLDRVETHWPLRIQLPRGTQVPFHCTASGKLYLSSLRSDKLDRMLSALHFEPETERSLTDPDALRAEVAQTRARDYAVDREEFLEGMSAISAPIRDTSGRLLTTLSIQAPTQRHDLASLVKMLPRLREATRRLEAMVSE